MYIQKESTLVTDKTLIVLIEKKKKDTNRFPFVVCDLNTNSLYDNKKLDQLNQLKTYKNTINIIYIYKKELRNLLIILSFNENKLNYTVT